jgi:predicted nucleotidyltransferase
MTLAGLQIAERERILAIAHRHGVTNVKLFGSFFPGGLIADPEEALGRKVDVVEDAALHHLLRDRILAEAVAL